MAAIVEYRLEGSIASVTMDDGKVNVMSLRMIEELGAAFDRAEADHAVVVLSGREGAFSAGFDLKVLRAGGAESLAMVRAGFELARRVLSFPTPVIVACTGHAIAMGLFLLVSGDYRVGVTGDYTLASNEVALGITMPSAAVALLRQRLTPAYFNRAVLLAEPFSPADAVQGGLLDRVVEAPRLRETVYGTAAAALNLNMAAHHGSKLRARQEVLEAIRAGIRADEAELMDAMRQHPEP